MIARRLLATASLAAAGVLVAGGAWGADRVAVLRFTASGLGTGAASLEAARSATREAVGLVHDALPSDAELAAAQAAVKDGVPDTSAEYRAAGAAAAAAWTVGGHVDSHGGTYRLELEACQVGTGRVESLAREVDARQAAPQIAEMLALLLRPQGVGDAVPPWDQPTPQAPKESAPPPKPAAETPPPPPGPEPPAEAPRARAYAEGHPFALAVGGEALTAFSRAAGAQGSPLAGLVTARAAYALPGAGLELVGDFAVSIAGPGSMRLDGAVRYLFPRRGVFFLGPEIGLGAFFTFGGDRDPRFFIEGSIPLVLCLGERFQIEGYPEIAYAAGGTTGLGLVGGGARAVLRF